MKFHDGGGGVMTGYHHHNLMDMYPGPAINTMDWKNTSQVGSTLVVITSLVTTWKIFISNLILVT